MDRDGEEQVIENASTLRFGLTMVIPVAPTQIARATRAVTGAKGAAVA